MEAALKLVGREREMQDVRLVSLFLTYLKEKTEWTPEEEQEFEHFQDIVARMNLKNVDWNDHIGTDLEQAPPSNDLFFKNDPGNSKEKAQCPGACCCSIDKRGCSTWFLINAFI